jgi:hypothetical protein
MDVRTGSKDTIAVAAGEVSLRALPRQHPYETAFKLGFDRLLAEPPSDETLRAIGAVSSSGVIRLPVLDRTALIDTHSRQVLVEDAGIIRLPWALLILHYLSAEDVSVDLREVSLGHFADCRGYLDVFAKRIVGRFLATAGRDNQRFVLLSEQLKAARVAGTGTGYRFDVLPRVPILIFRYDGDEEMPPGANVIYRADAAHLLPAEDRIVIAELLLDTLSGVPIEERVGGDG